MKRRGILNDALSGALARLGHTDTVVVADCGLPRPPGVAVVDLALVFGVPLDHGVTSLRSECARRESNPHARRHQDLNLARLPDFATRARD